MDLFGYVEYPHLLYLVNNCVYFLLEGHANSFFVNFCPGKELVKFDLEVVVQVNYPENHFEFISS